MGGLWILLGLGAAVMLLVAFEIKVMKSPKADLSGFDLVAEALEVILYALFQIF